MFPTSSHGSWPMRSAGAGSSRSTPSSGCSITCSPTTWTSSPRATFARERAEQLVLLGLANTRAARNAAFRKVAPVFGPRLLP